MTSSARRILFAAPLDLVISQDVDTREIDEFSTNILDLLSQFMPNKFRAGRGALSAYGMECRLLAAMAYFGISYLKDGLSPGQSFCNLYPIVQRKFPTESGVPAFVRPMRFQYYLLCLLCSVLPYLHQRSPTWLSFFMSRAMAHSHAHSNNGSPFSRLLTIWREQRAGLIHWTSQITEIFTDLHMLLFLFNGRYYNMAFRPLAVRFASSDPKPQRPSGLRGLASLQALCVLLRLLPIAATGTGLLYRLLFSGGEEGGTGEEDLPTAKAETVNAQSQSHHCPLCMELPTAACCGPCGHVYCWNCVGEWLSSQATATRCPVCRQPLAPQKLRLLANF